MKLLDLWWRQFWAMVAIALIALLGIANGSASAAAWPGSAAGVSYAYDCHEGPNPVTDLRGCQSLNWSKDVAFVTPRTFGRARRTEVGLASAGLGVGAAKVVGKAVRGFAETRVGRAVVEQLDGTPVAGLVRRVLGYADDGAAGTVERQVVRASSRDTATGSTVGVAKAQTNATKSGSGAIERVFRVYGGDSRAGGASWSPIDPRSVANYRDVAGLPSGNTGQFVIEGELADPSKVVLRRSALPLDGNTGGIPEYVIPDWMDNGAIRVTRVSGVNPEF